MEDKVLRFECLKLAANFSREKTEVLALAKIFENHISGPQVETQKSEKKPKRGNSRKSKVDNVSDLL